MSTVYQQIGGGAAVDAAVDIFYRKVLTDDRISRFFDDIDMDVQAAKQKAFLTMVLGGPANYTGQDMRRGHQHLIARGMNDDHVDAVIELLGQTLAELGVSPAAIGQIAGVAESVRDDVLDRPPGSPRGTQPGSSNTAAAAVAAEKRGPCGPSCGCAHNQ